MGSVIKNFLSKSFIVVLLSVGLSGGLYGNTKQDKTILNLTMNKNHNFTGVFKNAPLDKVLNKISDYNKMKVTIYPGLSAEFTFAFKNWTESKLIDKITQDINSFRVLAKNDNSKTKILLLAAKSSKIYKSKINIEDTEFNFDTRLKDFNQAKKVKIDIDKLPEVIALMKLSRKQKNYDLLYSRIVNPSNPSSIYTFKVRYNKQHDMMIPFEKNGEVVKNKAEGFINFTTVAKSIKKKKDSLIGYRDGKDLYLRFKDKNLKDTYMLLSGDSSNMEIVQTVKTPGFPNMQTRLNGNANEFTSLTKIYHKSGEIILANSVITQ